MQIFSEVNFSYSIANRRNLPGRIWNAPLRVGVMPSIVSRRSQLSQRSAGGHCPPLQPLHRNSAPLVPHKRGGVIFIYLSIQEIPQFLAAAGVAELAQRLGFNLTDTFTRNVEDFTNIFQGTHLTIIKTETET